MKNHFEELWEQCEKINQNNNADIPSILDEVIIKINLYKALNQKYNLPLTKEEEKIKTHLLGEILFSLTNLSIKDNINVYAALYSSVMFRQLP